MQPTDRAVIANAALNPTTIEFLRQIAAFFR